MRKEKFVHNEMSFVSELLKTEYAQHAKFRKL